MRGQTAMMAFRPLPRSAAWRHEAARDGLEPAFFSRRGGGYTIDGCTTAVDRGHAWVVHYAIAVDDDWRTQSARVTGWTEAGRRDVLLEGDGAGRWHVNGVTAPELDGCLDVDLESSAC